MTDKRDLRDPEALGERYLGLRKMGDSIDAAVYAPAKAYEDKGGIAAEQAAKYAAEFPEGLPEVNDDPGGA
jgi:hypothetical protein